MCTTSILSNGKSVKKNTSRSRSRYSGTESWNAGAPRVDVPLLYDYTCFQLAAISLGHEIIRFEQTLFGGLKYHKLRNVAALSVQHLKVGLKTSYNLPAFRRSVTTHETVRFK